MKFTSLLTATALAATIASPSIMAADSTLSDAQKTEIQTLVHDYLLNNPEVLLEVSQALQKKQQLTQQKQAQSAITDNASELFNDKMTTFGNPKGGVTLVEFFDYQCIHCKKMAPVIAELVKGDSNLRVIYKEFPIFGESSDMASRAALAAAMQNKYLQMHEALLGQEKHVDQKIIDETAKKIGLNMNKFKADMTGKEVTDALAANRKLAEQLHLMGTPAFIVGSTPGGVFKADSQPGFIPGGTDASTLKDLIKKAATN